MWIIFIFICWFLEGVGREKYRLIDSCMYEPWLGIQPATLLYWDDALPTELPSQGLYLLIFTVFKMHTETWNLLISLNNKISSLYNKSFWKVTISQSKKKKMKCSIVLQFCTYFLMPDLMEDAGFSYLLVHAVHWDTWFWLLYMKKIWLHEVG